MRKGHLHVKYAFMRFLKAIYIIKTIHKIILQNFKNYNEGMTLALARVYLCNVELSSILPTLPSIPVETTLATQITFTFITYQ